VRVSRVVVLVIAAGCRIGFDPLTEAPFDGMGTPIDVPAEAPVDGMGTPIAFVQTRDFDSNNNSSSANVTFTQPQTAGNLNIAVVAWGDTGRTVASLTDTAGNSYALAIGPTINDCVAQSIYFAPNIAGATTNTVTVTWDAQTMYPTLLMLEYAGGLSAVDQMTESTGTGNLAGTATVTTTFPRELVFAAGTPSNCVAPYFLTEGAGFTYRVITSVSGMLAQDIITSQTGSFSATGTLEASAPWVMQLVTFR
jgi:hypothetical protein